MTWVTFEALSDTRSFATVDSQTIELSRSSRDFRSMRAHKWIFKSRFRANASRWKGTALVTKQLKEAVSEIKRSPNPIR